MNRHDLDKRLRRALGQPRPLDLDRFTDQVMVELQAVAQAVGRGI